MTPPCRGGAARRPYAGPRIRAARWTAPTMSTVIIERPRRERIYPFLHRNGPGPVSSAHRTRQGGRPAWAGGLKSLPYDGCGGYRTSPVGAVQRAALTLGFRKGRPMDGPYDGCGGYRTSPVGSGHDPTASVTVPERSSCPREGWICFRGAEKMLIIRGKNPCKTLNMVIYLLCKVSVSVKRGARPSLSL